MMLRKKTQKAAIWIKSRLQSNALILGYHRISNPSVDPFFMNVSPENFSQQMEVLKKYALPKSLTHLVAAYNNGTIQRKNIAITFDDGYSDNYYKAKPILEKHDIPATVFVSSGKINKVFWWDELDRYTLSANTIPHEIQIEHSDGQFSWKQDWKPESPSQSLFLSLFDLMFELNEVQRQNIFDQLKDYIKPEHLGKEKHRTLNEAELNLIQADGLIDIGSHSVFHNNFSKIPVKELEYEITQSKKYLEALLDKPVNGFSYPNGMVTNVSGKIIKAAGYKYACTSYPNFIYKNSDLFQLPRFWIPDWDGDKFQKWLKRWMR